MNLGDRVTINIGIAYQFPQDRWCLLKERLGPAHRYGLTVLGGVLDGNYRGRIKVILLNIGGHPVVIPRHAAFCQAVLMPTDTTPLVPSRVTISGECGTQGGVNRDLHHGPRISGNVGRHGLGAVASRS